MSGYAIRLLIPKLKNIQNRIKNKNVGDSRKIGSAPSVNLIESPHKTDVLITTTSAPLLPPLPMKNCTQQEPDKQTGSFFYPNFCLSNHLFYLYWNSIKSTMSR